MATTSSKTGIDPLDFLATDALLSDEERAIRDTVRRFVSEQVKPYVGEWFEQRRSPAAELIPELARARPVRDAPRGLRPARGERGHVRPDLPRSSRRATPASAVSSRCRGRSRCTRSGGGDSEEQKQRWLPPMHAGEQIGCFGLTEPDAGSDPGSMRTHARRDGSDWILNGAKMWITNGSIADVAIVWARTDDGDINGFLVEKDMPGFQRAGDAPASSRCGRRSRRSSCCSDVRVPEENRFPEVDSLRGPLSCLNEARYGIVCGVGRRCARVLRGGARLRRRSGSSSTSRSPATS